MKKILSTKNLLLSSLLVFLRTQKINPMYKSFFLILFLLPLFVSSQTLPKDCYGFYAGEMVAYTVMKNDVEMNIEKHDVEVHVTDQFVSYTSGNLMLKGTYTFLKQTGSQYLIKAVLTNGKSVNYELDLLWDKKQKSLFLAGKNGEPDLLLEKLDS